MNTTDKCIMQILPSLKGGGVERGTVDVAKYLQDNGIPNIVVSEGGPMVSQLEAAGIKHITLPVATKNPLKVVGNIGKLAGVIRQFNVGLVHARSRAPAWSAYFACKRTGAKFMTTFHGLYGTNPSIKKIYNRIMVKGEKVIAVSDFIASHIKMVYRVDPSKVVAIKRGIDTDLFDASRFSSEGVARIKRKYALPEDKKIISMPTRITPIKGIEVVIKAVSKIPGVFLMIVGSDHGRESYKKGLEKLVSDMGLEDRVKFYPPTSSVEEVFAISDIFVGATINAEAFGRTIGESMAMGVMTISTVDSGPRELIKDGITGFEVKTNDVGDMERVIKSVLSLSESQRDEIAGNARKFIINEASLQQMYRKTMEVYKSLL